MRESLSLAVMLYALLYGSEACAGDPQRLEPEPKHDEKVSMEVPARFSLAGIPLESWQPPKEYSETEFRPRRPLSAQNAASDAEAAQSFAATTVWQRLKDFRSKDRLRLITLWESAGSSLSIQTTKRGEPSLQWSSSSMNRGGATRGLLDDVIAGSFGVTGLAQVHRSPHPSAATPIRPMMSRTAAAAQLP